MASKTKKKMETKIGKRIPKTKFKTRVRVPKSKLSNPYKWKTLKSDTLFKNKKIVIISLPGAFTPICNNRQLPDYEKKYDKLIELGVDEVYCISVNDAFVMGNWGRKLGIKRVKLLPDGNGDFTKKMGALVEKKNLGFGPRSWRYSMVVKNGKIEKIFEEPGMKSNCKTDPYTCSDVDTMISYLKSKK
jgi:thioredoxin-dependent peroxiredoxin